MLCGVYVSLRSASDLCYIKLQTGIPHTTTAVQNEQVAIREIYLFIFILTADLCI